MWEGHTSATVMNGARLDFPIQRPLFDSTQNAPEANYRYLSQLRLKGGGEKKTMKVKLRRGVAI